VQHTILPSFTEIRHLVFRHFATYASCISRAGMEKSKLIDTDTVRAEYQPI
jgi:hypothetical protein